MVTNHVRSARTRERIVASAVKNFGSKGYELTSISDIVDPLKITKGAFYHHFPSKQGLLAEIHQRVMDKVNASIEGPLMESEDVADALRSIMVAMIEIVWTHQREMIVFFSEFRNIQGAEWERIRAQRLTFEERLTELIARGIEVGEFAIEAGHARVVAYGILSIPAWATHWLKSAGDLGPERVGQLLADMVLHGLLSSSAR